MRGRVGVGSRDDAALVAALRRSDATALGEAYDAHHLAVRAFARRLLGDESTAEDLVQDVFLALPRAVERFRGECTLRTLLISIAVNHASHHLRSAMRRRAAHSRLLSEPPPSAPDVEEQLRRARTREALTRALDALPLDQRVAIVLCEVEERTSAEAAEIVGVPAGTIRTRVLHGKRRLREALAQGGRE